MPTNTNTTPGQVLAAMSGLNANEYPTTSVSTDNAALTIWDGEPAAYDHWQCVNEYVEEAGVAILPTSNYGLTGAQVNVAVEYCSTMVTLVQRWAAKRTGAPPRFPPKIVYTEANSSLNTLGSTTQTPDPNWVYIGGIAPQVRELGIAPDGVSIIYEASGVHVFQALNASLVNYNAPVSPTLNPVKTAIARTWANDNNPPPSSVAIQNFAAGVVPGITGAISPGSLSNPGGNIANSAFPPSVPTYVPFNPFATPMVGSPLGSNPFSSGG